MIEKLENKKWKVLKSEYLAHEPWFTVRRECVELPNGNQVPSWYVLEYPDWINVIALTKNGDFVFISQYRHALGVTNYELVAGVCDPTDKSPMEAAKRELYEETGYGNGKWSEFMVLSPNPTSHTNMTYTYLALDVEPVSTQHTEPTEDIHVHILTYEDVKELLDKGEIIQALHAAPLWKYVAEREREKRR